MVTGPALELALIKHSFCRHDRLRAPGACKCRAPSTARTRTRTASAHILEHLLPPLQNGAAELPTLHLERKAVVLSMPRTRRFQYNSKLEELFRAQALAAIQIDPRLETTMLLRVADVLHSLNPPYHLLVFWDKDRAWLAPRGC